MVLPPSLYGYVFSQTKKTDLVKACVKLFSNITSLQRNLQKFEKSKS